MTEEEKKEEVAAKPAVARTTYYNAFPLEPRQNSILVSVLWAIKHDYRLLSTTERRNVVYPAKSAGLVDPAPQNSRGVRINLKGKTSCCGFVLTELGEKYYNKVILPLIPKGFTSEKPRAPRTRIKSETFLEELVNQ